MIEWDCGWGADPSPSPSPVVEEPEVDVTGLNKHDKQWLQRDKKRHEKEKAAVAKQQEVEGDEEERST